MAKYPPDPTEADLQMQAQLGAILSNLAVLTGFLADLSSGHARVLRDDDPVIGTTWRVIPNDRREFDGWSEDAGGVPPR